VTGGDTRSVGDGDRSGGRSSATVVVVGGANVDIKAHSAKRALPRSSNPGSAVTSLGGVGRNIAENLARLRDRTHLVTAVGRDTFGEQVVAGTRSAGVLVDHVITLDGSTGTYLAVIDADGELLVAVADMQVADRLTVEHLLPVRDLLRQTDLLVVDGNIPHDPMAWLLDEAADAGIRVVVDPVSVAKAHRLAGVLSPRRPVLAITPNHDELAALAGSSVSSTRAGILGAAQLLHARGVQHVWVRQGTRGSLLCSRGEDGLPTATTLSAPVAGVVDVTGAGDAMTAAFVHALLRGEPPEDAARLGQVAAALTVESQHAVRPDLTENLVDAERRRVDRQGTTKERLR
jgi:pseudouridine kinase